jgi:hypothetical protein
MGVDKGVLQSDRLRSVLIPHRPSQVSTITPQGVRESLGSPLIMELGFVYSRAFVSRFKSKASVLVLLSEPHTHLPIFASLADYSFVEYWFFVVVK